MDFVGTCEEDDNQRMIHDFVEMKMYSHSYQRSFRNEKQFTEIQIIFIVFIIHILDAKL